MKSALAIGLAGTFFHYQDELIADQRFHNRLVLALIALVVLVVGLGLTSPATAQPQRNQLAA